MPGFLKDLLFPTQGDGSGPAQREGVQAGAQTRTDSLLAVGAAASGVVGERHHLAEAGTIDIASFAAEPMLFNPRAPAAWMRPFWLEDLRSAAGQGWWRSTRRIRRRCCARRWPGER